MYNSISSGTLLVNTNFKSINVNVSKCVTKSCPIRPSSFENVYNVNVNYNICIIEIMFTEYEDNSGLDIFN